MKAPSQKRINMEVKKLEIMLPDVRRFSMFNDDHHAAIRAQIDVLKGNLDEDDIEGRWPADEYGNTNENAREAYFWMIGESEYETLTENWEGLMNCHND